MGQKTHPYGLRLGYIKPWRARWFGKGKQLVEFLHEDLKLRRLVKDKLSFAGISAVEIERSSGRVRVRIHTARPGIIIGRRGQEIDRIKEELADLVGDKEIFVDIKEIKEPQVDAQLVAENVATQLEKRVSFRRAMKKALQNAQSRGCLGIKLQAKGRLGGSEIARAEGYHEGKIPLGTFRADIDYGFATAFTTYGTIGVKAWIYKGEVLLKKQEAEQKEAGLKRLEKTVGKAEEAKPEPQTPAAEEPAAKPEETGTPVPAPAPAPEPETGTPETKE